MTEERAKEIWPFIKAYSEGKQLQFRLMGNEYVNWLPVLPAHDWNDDDFIYRIKPEELEPKRMTFRQLAEWLAKGNGHYQCFKSDRCYHAIGFSHSEDTKEVTKDYEIRRWDSDEWIEPTLDVYLKDCKGVVSE